VSAVDIASAKIRQLEGDVIAAQGDSVLALLSPDVASESRR